MKKNPLLAAILNILIVGLGYIYTGKRILFGILLLSAECSAILWLIFNPDLAASNIMLHPLNIASTFIFLLALAIDGYRDAQAENIARQLLKDQFMREQVLKK